MSAAKSARQSGDNHSAYALGRQGGFDDFDDFEDDFSSSQSPRDSYRNSPSLSQKRGGEAARANDRQGGEFDDFDGFEDDFSSSQSPRDSYRSSPSPSQKRGGEAIRANDRQGGGYGRTGGSSGSGGGKKTPKRISTIILSSVLAVAAVAAGVFLYIYFNSHILIGGEFYSKFDTVIDLSNSDLTDVTELVELSNLQQLDLRGNELYAVDIDRLQISLPDCDIRWSVPVNGQRFDSYAESITIGAASVEDIANLFYFKNLKSVDATGCTEYEALLAQSNIMPDCVFTWNISILGKEYLSSDTEIDLSNTKIEDFEGFSQLLQYLPNLKKADMFSCGLTDEQMKALCDMYPSCTFNWTYTLAGAKVKTNAEKINIEKRAVGSLDSVRESLKYFKNLKQIDMSDCGLTNSDMEVLMSEFPNVKFVWRVHMRRWSLKTNTKVFSTKEARSNPTKLKTEDIEVLKYCTDLIALDLGHNAIHDITVIGKLTNLEILILIDNGFKDISPLKNLKKVWFLEIFMNQIVDISPLTEMPELMDLNIGHNRVSDISPVYKIPKLKRFWCGVNRINANDRAEFPKKRPDVECDFYTYNPVDGGWRSNERFKDMRRLFGLPITEY
jgi:Leucine-rich repeat (LRR) protein